MAVEKQDYCLSPSFRGKWNREIFAKHRAHFREKGRALIVTLLHRKTPAWLGLGRFLPCEAKGRCSVRRSGFTLLELLVATAIFATLVLVLATISNQALGTWSRSENKSELREAARTAINLMGSELRQAVLPVYRGDTNGLQLVVNPASLSATFKNRDAIFWQAPVATSRTKGDLAIVGYFIRKEGNVSKLCRFFVNPDDTNYLIYSSPNAWVTDALLNSRAPADEASDLQGVFLENVPGMWITVYTNATAPYATDYNSLTAQVLPARVEISLALLDKIGAQRVADGASLPDVAANASASAFMANLPENLRSHVEAVTINVPF